MNGEKCTGHKRDGSRCKNYPLDGATVCGAHGGKAPQVKAKAALRHEVMSWGLGDVHVDLVQLVLRMISQSVTRAEMYAAEVERLVAEAPTLEEALVGDVEGEFGKAGEYVKAMARLEAEERDRFAGWTFKALAVGIAARQIDVARDRELAMAEVLREFLAHPELQLSATQRAVAPMVLRQVLGLSGALTIEGSTE